MKKIKLEKNPIKDNKKVSFEMILFNDMKYKEEMLNRIEIMFDDSRNDFFSKDYDYFVNKIPYGSKIKVTFEQIK